MTKDDLSKAIQRQNISNMCTTELRHLASKKADLSNKLLLLQAKELELTLLATVFSGLIDTLNPIVLGGKETLSDPKELKGTYMDKVKISGAKIAEYGGNLESVIGTVDVQVSQAQVALSKKIDEVSDKLNKTQTDIFNTEFYMERALSALR